MNRLMFAALAAMGTCVPQGASAVTLVESNVGATYSGGNMGTPFSTPSQTNGGLWFSGLTRYSEFAEFRITAQVHNSYLQIVIGRWDAALGINSSNTILTVTFTSPEGLFNPNGNFYLSGCSLQCQQNRLPSSVTADAHTITVKFKDVYGFDSFRLNLAPPVTPEVPEPASWMLMIAGFGAAGAALRRRRGNDRRTRAAAAGI